MSRVQLSEWITNEGLESAVLEILRTRPGGMSKASLWEELPSPIPARISYDRLGRTLARLFRHGKITNGEKRSCVWTIVSTSP